jgi:hypothetical protein
MRPLVSEFRQVARYKFSSGDLVATVPLKVNDRVQKYSLYFLKLKYLHGTFTEELHRNPKQEMYYFKGCTEKLHHTLNCIILCYVYIRYRTMSKTIHVLKQQFRDTKLVLRIK